MKSTKTYEVWADWIRVIATFLVIIIHLSAGILIAWPDGIGLQWWVAHIYDSIARSSVPLFVILSGSLLLSKEEPLKVFFIKRVRRVVLPWIWWVLVTLIVDYIFFQNSFSGLKMTQILSRYFVTGFWFMPLLLQLYLAVPLLRSSIKKIPPIIGFVGSFILLFLLAIQSTSCRISGECAPWNLPLGVQFLGFFIAGFYLQKVQLNTKKIWFLVGVWLFSLLVILIGTYQLSSYRGTFSEDLYQYTSLPVVLMSIAGFLLLKYLFTNFLFLSQKKAAVLHTLSTASFGIFLVHALLIKLIAATPTVIIFTSLPSWAIVGIPLLSVVMFSLSFAVIVVMKKNRLLRIFT